MRIGVDLGGTKTEIIVLDNNGAELYRKRTPTKRGNYQGILDTIVGLVHDAETELGQECPVGVGVPGCISGKTGKVKNANSTELNGNDLHKDLSKMLDREVRCVNDANCLAISEATDGAGAGKKLVFAVIIGTGCGSGIAIDGEVWSGGNLVAGEWGHNPLPFMNDDEFPGADCWCGKRGCLETFISGTGFEKDYAKYETNGEIIKNGADIIKLARNGDKGANKALERYADRLARGLAQVINIIDPDIIVLGGGMSNVNELYDMVPPLLPNYVFGHEVDTTIVRNMHGDSSGVRGAAWLWPRKKREKAA